MTEHQEPPTPDPTDGPGVVHNRVERVDGTEQLAIFTNDDRAYTEWASATGSESFVDLAEWR